MTGEGLYGQEYLGSGEDVDNVNYFSHIFLEGGLRFVKTVIAKQRKQTGGATHNVKKLTQSIFDEGPFSDLR